MNGKCEYLDDKAIVILINVNQVLIVHVMINVKHIQKVEKNLMIVVYGWTVCGKTSANITTQKCIEKYSIEDGKYAEDEKDYVRVKCAFHMELILSISSFLTFSFTWNSFTAYSLLFFLT